MPAAMSVDCSKLTVAAAPQVPDRLCIDASASTVAAEHQVSERRRRRHHRGSRGRRGSRTRVNHREREPLTTIPLDDRIDRPLMPGRGTDARVKWKSDGHGRYVKPEVDSPKPDVKSCNFSDIRLTKRINPEIPYASADDLGKRRARWGGDVKLGDNVVSTHQQSRQKQGTARSRGVSSQGRHKTARGSATPMHRRPDTPPRQRPSSSSHQGAPAASSSQVPTANPGLAHQHKRALDALLASQAAEVFFSSSDQIAISYSEEQPSSSHLVITAN